MTAQIDGLSETNMPISGGQVGICTDQMWHTRQNSGLLYGLDWPLWMICPTCARPDERGFRGGFHRAAPCDRNNPNTASRCVPQSQTKGLRKTHNVLSWTGDRPKIFPCVPWAVQPRVLSSRRVHNTAPPAILSKRAYKCVLRDLSLYAAGASKGLTRRVDLSHRKSTTHLTFLLASST